MKGDNKMTAKVKCEGSGIEGRPVKGSTALIGCQLCKYSQVIKKNGSAKDLIDTHYFGERVRADSWAF